MPGRSDRPVQLIDVKDVATCAFDMAENRKTGTFNVTGPRNALTIEELLNTCKMVTNSESQFIWADESFLLEQQVQPWTEMPLWAPEHFPLEGEEEPWKGTFLINTQKAVHAGLSFRPLYETIHDIYQWMKERKYTVQKAGISLEKEQELLEAWFQREKK